MNQAQAICTAFATAKRFYGDAATVTSDLPRGWTQVESFRDGLPVVNFGIRWSGSDSPGNFHVTTWGPRNGEYVCFGD